MLNYKMINLNSYIITLQEKIKTYEKYHQILICKLKILN